jgi:hypothetical protein
MSTSIDKKEVESLKSFGKEKENSQIGGEKLFVCVWDSIHNTSFSL